jgi:predicted amidohydrolase
LHVKVTIAQVAPATDKVANLAGIERQVARAASEGTDLIVFPEMSSYYQKALDGGFGANAEPIPGEFTRAIDNLAKGAEVGIAVGHLETAPDESRPFNTIYVTGRNGRMLTTYRKMHLYDAFGYQESEVFTPAADLTAVTFEFGAVTIGLMTCYDLRFPEVARRLIDAGADVLLVPAAWTPGVRKEDHWETLVRARAIENTCYVVASNHAQPSSTGGSLIVDPMGVVLAQGDEGVSHRTVELDPARIADVRRTNPSLANRRLRIEDPSKVARVGG